MPVIGDDNKATEVTDNVAFGVGKTLGDAARAAGNAFDRAGANNAKSFNPNSFNGSSNGLNSTSGNNGLGGNNEFGNSNHRLGNNNRNDVNPNLGNNRNNLGRKQGIGGNDQAPMQNNNNYAKNNSGLNKNNGFNNTNGLGNKSKTSEDGLHKKGLKKPNLARRNPISSIKNHMQRVAQEKEKMRERGEDPSDFIANIRAIPFVTKVVVAAFVTLITFLVFGVPILGAYGEYDYIEDIVVSSTVSGITSSYSSVVSPTPVQVSSPSEVVDSYIDSHVSEQYQDTAHNIGYNQTLTTSEGTPITEDELLYNQKIADIAFRYKQLYNIDLDWVLITVSNLYGFGSERGFYNKNVGGYDSNAVTNLDETMSLDWDYDYKDIEGYNYLEKGNYTYDLQILAKNMVTKTTIQQCVSGTTVLKTKEVIDLEDGKLDEEHPDYLKCETGTYEVKSEYKIDKEKYDDFLTEYLDNRYHGTPGDPSSSSGSPTAPSTSGRWGWPLPIGASRCRSSVYGYRVHPITGKVHYHSGDDYPAAGGTPVYAIGEGTVIAVNTGCTVGNTNCGGGAGNYVKIDHGGGVVSVYMHASKVLVTKGQHVSRGEEIMKVGTTGSSTGNHLHITIRLNGQLDDPSKYIGALPVC